VAVKSLVEVGNASIPPAVGVIEVLCGPLLGLEPGELALSLVELIAVILKTLLRFTQRLSGDPGPGLAERDRVRAGSYPEWASWRARAAARSFTHAKAASRESIRRPSLRIVTSSVVGGRA
jgi:hypothetical protein